MSPDAALYRPDGEDIAELCADLRAAGLIDGGPDIALRLRAAFARLDPMPAERVLGVVLAVCRRAPDPAWRAALDAVAGDWLAGLRPVVEPVARRDGDGAPPLGEPGAEPVAGGAPRWLIAVLVVGLAGLAALLVTPAPDAPGAPDGGIDAAPVGLDAGADDIADAIADAITDTTTDGTALVDGTTDITLSDAIADTEIDAAPDAAIRRPRRPTYTGFTEPAPSPWPVPWALAGLFALLAAAGVIGRLARDLEPIPRPPRRPRGRRERRHPPRPLPASLHSPPRMLPRDADRRLAGSDQRATADPASRVLDVGASVKATAARDGRVPVVRFRPLRRPEPLDLWVDWAARARTPVLAGTIDELLDALRRAGVSHARKHFIDHPEVLVDGGRRVVLDGLPLDRRNARVAVVTDGHGLMRLDAPHARRLGARLGRIDHLAVFVFGALDPQRLGDRLGLSGRVHRDDRLLPWIADRAPGRPQPVDPTQLRTWAAVCALAPRGTTDTDALSLAAHLGLSAPPSALEALRADCGSPRLEWPTPRRAALIDALSAEAPERRDAAVAWWHGRYPSGWPETSEQAQWALERLTLDLWTDDIDGVVAAAEAIDRLRLDADARRLLGAFAPRDVRPDAPLVHLPWAWRDLASARARRQLARLGLAGGSLPRPPARRFALFGLAAGLALAAAVGAFTAPRGAGRVAGPCVIERPAADGLPTEVWRCGTMSAARPSHPAWPAHSAVALFDRPDDAAAADLALALLDSGAADSVWWSGLPPVEAADQRIAVVPGGLGCPAGATACVRAADWRGLTGRLGAEVRPLVEVWPWVEQGAGWLVGGAYEAEAVTHEAVVQHHAATRYRPALVLIRPGEFTMGSPEDEVGRVDGELSRRVKLTRGFLMAESEVTQAHYSALMGSNPSYFQGGIADSQRPVEQVSWLDAVAYCNALSVAEGLAPAYVIAGGTVEWDESAGGYRLPTEAEWEYAARAGTATATYAGDIDIRGAHHAPLLDDIAWYGGNSGSDHPKAVDSSGWSGKQYPHTRAATHAVKGKRPNAWGLYDMLGNVYEWAWDRHDGHPPMATDGPVVDPKGLPRGDGRLIRGGAFDDVARWLRAAYRFGVVPAVRGRVLGFRPVRFVVPSDEGG